MKLFLKQIDSTRAASTLLLFCLPVALTTLPTPTRAAAPRPPVTRIRISVEPFGYSGISPWWSGNWQIGQGMSTLLADELSRQSSFDVYGIGPRVSEGAILQGTITRFEFDDNSFRASERDGRWGHRASSQSLFGIGLSETRAIVEMECRLIDAASGRILKTFKAKGQSSKGVFSGFGIRRGPGIYAEGIDFRSRAFQDTLVGEAARKCVTDLSRQLIQASGTLDLSSAPQKVTGKIADVDDDTLTVNIGANQGVRVGDTLSVEAVLKLIRDPDTGKVIDERAERLGTIHITTVTARTATGKYEGSSSPKVGDRVYLD